MNKQENKLEDYGVLIRETFGGSISYGTNHNKSDVDIRGIFIPHRKFLLGMSKVEQFNDKTERSTGFGIADDIEYFSLQKFIKLALEGNPNVVEQLFVDNKHLIFENEIGKELYDLRYEFLTKNTYNGFCGYAYSQMKKMDSKGNHNSHSSHKDIISEFGYDTKHAMHLIRLFQMGIQILKHGELSTLRPNNNELIDIRHGKYSLEYIKRYAEELSIELGSTMKESKIPDYPNFNKINKWVVDVVDKNHGKDNKKGVFKGITFNVLPLEYEMIDKCSLLVVSNKLLKNKSKSNATGVAVPYKDWFTGLRNFNEFKFEQTVISNILKAVSNFRDCDPRMVDMLYAPKQYVVYEHEMAEEFKDMMKKLFTTKKAYYKAYNYVVGNIKKMQNWEQTKEKWEKTKENSTKEISEYPPVPKKTLTENASMMTKFGYDTLLASDIVHILRLFTELMNTGTILNSRVYESELRSIKNGHYKNFNDFNSHVENLLKDLNDARDNSVLKEHNFNDVEKWLIDFIDRFHLKLN